MAESKADWDRVGQEFRELGRQVREHYQRRPRPEEAGEPAGDEQAGQGQQPAADRRKVDETLERLTESLEQAFSALGDALRDPRFGEQTRKAAGSLNDALTATFAEASERFRKR